MKKPAIINGESDWYEPTEMECELESRLQNDLGIQLTPVEPIVFMRYGVTYCFLSRRFKGESKTSHQATIWYVRQPFDSNREHWPTYFDDLLHRTPEEEFAYINISGLRMIAECSRYLDQDPVYAVHTGNIIEQNEIDNKVLTQWVFSYLACEPRITGDQWTECLRRPVRVASFLNHEKYNIHAKWDPDPHNQAKFAIENEQASGVKVFTDMHL
jgi:hypothetical protein